MHDVIVLGGSYSGMSAALQLARARKSVLVIDAGSRRNRFADESHGFLGQDGRSPADIADDAKRQLLAYPSVNWESRTAIGVSGSADGFLVDTDGDSVFQARRLVVAVGVTDILPDIPGLEAQWGSGAMTCPYCHAYEMNGGEMAVLATGPMSVHHAAVVSEWGPTTLFVNGAFEIDAGQRLDLEGRGISIVETRVAGVSGPRGRPTIMLADGRIIGFAGLFVAARVEVRTPIPAMLGCEFTESPAGRLIRVDATQATTVPGVFACGDVSSPMASIALSVGSGAMAGAAVHRSMIFTSPGRGAS